jgi:hypothetical protein
MHTRCAFFFLRACPRNAPSAEQRMSAAKGTLRSRANPSGNLLALPSLASLAPGYDANAIERGYKPREEYKSLGSTGLGSLGQQSGSTAWANKFRSTVLDQTKAGISETRATAGTTRPFRPKQCLFCCGRRGCGRRLRQRPKLEQADSEAANGTSQQSEQNQCGKTLKNLEFFLGHISLFTFDKPGCTASKFSMSDTILRAGKSR